MLDNNSVILADELNRLADQVDQELQESAIANSLSIKRNQMILMLSVPMVLGIFGGLIVKFSLLLKQQMRNLELRTSQLNSILNTAPSAIITVDDLANVLTFNPAAERIFGYTPNEIIGNSINRLMPLEVAAGHDAYIKNYLKTGQAKVIGMPREVMAVRQNGEEFPAQFRINCMEIEGKSFFCGIIDDISETKTLQVQLNQAQKLEAIGQMASGVAHEINTPIQYIGDNLSALKENFVDIIEFQKKLNSINAEEIQTQLHSWKSQHDLDFILEDSPKAIQQALEGVEKVSEIVKAMKTFSHMEPSQGTQVINLHEAINSALIISRNSYKYYADIETDFSKDVESLECYPSELNQVFLNLIINAAHAIEEKYSVDRRGLIRIVTRLIPGMVEILIQDNGSGIPEAIQEKVYNLFFTTKPVGKGTGQGLSLSHSIIVEKHQGKLFFESSHAEGTTFHIQLPLKMVNTGTNNHG
jgi:PAS domain S-box-containing protein